jgi:hypothetical protein
MKYMLFTLAFIATVAAAAWWDEITKRSRR